MESGPARGRFSFGLVSSLSPRGGEGKGEGGVAPMILNEAVPPGEGDVWARAVGNVLRNED